MLFTHTHTHTGLTLSEVVPSVVFSLIYIQICLEEGSVELHLIMMTTYEN